ncbi:membrane protein insertase YidC [Rickettsia endosymbiont of Cardiosporidium cionae]|uniref:membrane protein insertase YidC n=1 Tax=Rickettsia endosymbiont of Cardiosporidium cionae TaxID=2777155 RepID=UPI0018954064|nr:membrane protein insertase YidC [Rickettsia endosymbiont of Cardiosporidium cionae]KAF8818593.1 membrane protein insertase YidC [Rickettsia endosymbiont of Cardiosporidium cionae]
MNHSFLNLIVSLVISLLIIFGWNYFYKKLSTDSNQNIANKRNTENDQKNNKNSYKEEYSSTNKLTKKDKTLEKVIIDSDTLLGSIDLKGIRFDNLILKNYQKTLDNDSEFVELLSYKNTHRYFIECGWISNDTNIDTPNNNSIWKSDKQTLKANDSVTLTWVNSKNILFKIEISLDQHYLFTIRQSITNNSGKTISTKLYGLINRNYVDESQPYNMSNIHQGFIGNINNKLEEYKYSDVKEKQKITFDQTKVDWIGITDKYWLTSFVPDKSLTYNTNYQYSNSSNQERYQADFISYNQSIDDNNTLSVTHRVFLGAKKVDLLDHYEKIHDIKLFDRAIDFGWFYVLTKPIFYAMNYFYTYVGNFGISIMIVTILIKLMMFTLSNKSHRSVQKMKSLQPEIERIKEIYQNDKTKINQEVMLLYKKEKVNPVAGCLPIIIQIPVFFSIYKVLCVTIEMRHAPFFLWIRDLSASDPSNIFNLFGMLSFNTPDFLHIGAWPIIMALTMLIQQRLNPEPADPIQAMLMKFMPLIFLFMFANFPAGLLIYWSWNNILSILQQLYINHISTKLQT